MRLGTTITIVKCLNERCVGGIIQGLSTTRSGDFAEIVT